jgi:hypothetical protein
MGEYNRAMRAYNEVYEETPTYSDEVYYCWDGRAIPWSYLNDGDCDFDNCEDEDE